MTEALLTEPPLVVQRSLVRLLGMTEAVLLQQLHYWLRRATVEHDDHRWVYKTYERWGEEIGISAKAARGALDRLRELGVVVAITNPSDARDRTLWWRIDRPALTALAGSPSSARRGTSTSARRGSSSKAETTSRDSRSLTLAVSSESNGNGASPNGYGTSPPERKPKTVGRKKVTDAEHQLADDVLAAFNAVAGTSLTAVTWREKIVRRAREHPELSVADHQGIIERNFRAPWWADEPSPSVIYGNDAIFEKAMACRGIPKARSAVDQSREEAAALRRRGADALERIMNGASA